MKDFETIIKECEAFISSNSSSAFAPTALQIAVHSYKQNGDFEGMKYFLDEIIAEKNLENLHGAAKLKLIDYYNEKKNYNESLEIANSIISSYGKTNSKKFDENLFCQTLLEKGYVYEYSLDKKEEAIKTYTELIATYPDNDLAVFAKAQLKNLGIELKEIPGTEIHDSESSELSIENYPNPFNPTTTIAVSLPKQDDVKLIVFDVLGREVIKLADGNFEAGKHNFKFNAANLPSGIYFYNIRTSGQSITKKMMLLK